MVSTRLIEHYGFDEFGATIMSVLEVGSFEFDWFEKMPLLL